MKNTLKCCISCILPCGALDVVRIIHSNGHVEEFSQTIRASDVMKANPKHVLRKSVISSDQGDLPRIVILSPETELQRGKIYFLVPMSSLPKKTQSEEKRKKKKKKEDESFSENSITVKKMIVSDQYLNKILSEKVSCQRNRRKGRVGIWRPHLESIAEISNDL